MATKSKLGTQKSADVTAIRNLALKAMQAALKPYGISVKGLSGTRGSTAKLRFEFIPGTGKAAVLKATNLSKLGAWNGLTPKDIGKTFVSNGKTFRFDDVNPRRYKFPISGTDVKTGKTFKFGPGVALKINAKAAVNPLAAFNF